MSKTIRITYLEVIYPKDTVGFHELMGHVLSQPEFQVTTLPADKTNSEDIIATRPNLIVVDMRRSKSPNLKLHQKIILSDELNNLPILIVTEKGYDPTPLGFEYTILDDYVCHPLFGESEFLLVVNSLLERAKVNH